MQCRVFHEHFQIFYLFIHFIFLLFNLDLNQFTEIGGSKELTSTLWNGQIEKLNGNPNHSNNH